MYQVDGEVGRFQFKTHKVVTERGTVFDSAKDIFRTLHSKEWYRTQGFNELAFDLVVDESYRKADKKLNRVRREGKGGTPSRTLANVVEIEGKKIDGHIKSKAADIFKEYDFACNGVPNDNSRIYGIELERAKIKDYVVKEAIEKYNRFKEDDLKIDEEQSLRYYEESSSTVNMSVDDVGVKKQVEHREKNEIKKLKYVRNTIVHIENVKEKYFLNAESTISVLPIIIAFLLYNRLMNSYLQFFVDGEQSLHAAILGKFSWHKSFGILLDWYHLKKKCETELSLAMNNKNKRNLVLGEVLKYLWIGKIDKVINVLISIDSTCIKSSKNIDVLIKYLERNRNYIPCYALRKELGLRNSSNKGEKSNDMIVSERQKHNGMSWSKDGSISLATVTTAHLNDELHKWFDKGVIDFKLVS